jgi:hypothetical protein
MAQILITNYTGTVTSDIVVCEANAGPTIGTCYNLATLYGTSGQISPTTTLPAWYTLPNNFDYDSFCYIQLSASTTLFTVPQLIQCGVEPPQTWGFESCGQPLDKNIYVFYDTSGSYPDGVNSTNGNPYDTLSAASESIRAWYYDLVTISGYTGSLFEIPVANERYLNWSCYPYLGSTTGGTLSDSSTVRIEMGRITNASNTPTGPTTGPVWTSPIISRMALGKDLTTGNPLPLSPGYSSGVPFDHVNYNLSGCVLGQFDGGDTNYISIIVLNEACNINTNGGCYALMSTSGGTDRLQPYFTFDADLTNNSFLHLDNTTGQINSSNPVQYIYAPDYCAGYPAYTDPSYSGSSLVRDYQSWIKVWEDVNINLNGFSKVFLFPVPTKNVTAAAADPQYQAQGFGTLYQAIELIEGEIPQAPSYFQSTYCDGPFSTTGTQWPYPNARYNQYSAWTYNQGQYYDFSPLSYYNKFTGLTATTAYSSLPTQYKVGPGLKNFGWSVDATITGFTQALVANDLNGYFTNVLAGSNIYTTTEPVGLQEDSVYTIQDFEGCWTYTGYRLDGQPSYNLINTIDEFISCLECQGDQNPNQVEFKFNGWREVSNDPGNSSQFAINGTIDVFGVANDDVDFEISWPFPLGTDIPNIVVQFNFGSGLQTFSPGVTTGKTLTLNSSGIGNVPWKLTVGNNPYYGFEYIKLTLTGTTGGASIINSLNPLNMTTEIGLDLSPNPDFYSLTWSRVPSPGASTYMMVGGISSVSATTSGTACSQFAINKSYLITPVIGTQDLNYILNNYTTTNFQLLDGQTTSPVGSANKWIAIANTYYTVYGYTLNTIAIQVDSSGYIINAVQC